MPGQFCNARRWGKAAETLGETKAEVKSVKSGKGGTQSKEREELSPEELEERRQKRREEHLGSFCASWRRFFFCEVGGVCRWLLLCALSSVGWCVPYTNLCDQWQDVKDERMKDEQTSHDWTEHAKQLMSMSYTRHMRQTIHCDDDGWSSCLRLFWKICSCNSSPTKIRMEEDLFPRPQVEEGRGKAERNCKVPILMKQMLWDKLFVDTGFGKIWRCFFWKTKCTNPEFGSSHKCAFTADQSWPSRKDKEKRKQRKEAERLRKEKKKAQIMWGWLQSPNSCSSSNGGRGRKEKVWSRQSRWRDALLQGTARNWAVTSAERYI